MNPAKIHVVVPKGRRIRRSVPSDYLLHKEDVDPGDLTWWEQIPVVTLRKAVEQCIDSGLADYLVRQAIERGSKTGQLIADEPQELMKRLEARHDR